MCIRDRNHGVQIGNISTPLASKYTHTSIRIHTPTYHCYIPTSVRRMREESKMKEKCFILTPMVCICLNLPILAPWYWHKKWSKLSVHVVYVNSQSIELGSQTKLPVTRSELDRFENFAISFLAEDLERLKILYNIFKSHPTPHPLSRTWNSNFARSRTVTLLHSEFMSLLFSWALTVQTDGFMM